MQAHLILGGRLTLYAFGEDATDTLASAFEIFSDFGALEGFIRMVGISLDPIIAMTAMATQSNAGCGFIAFMIALSVAKVALTTFSRPVRKP